jgi:serine/threonine-protein kinase
MPLSPGDRIERYEILERLGAGGMGEVYRARDPRLGRDVAIKVVRVDRHVETEGGARLLREARAAAGLSHACVVAVHDVGELEQPEPLRGTTYIVMELVSGHALRAYVGDASVPIARRVAWLTDVARALAAAHDAGIVHRDVKPENVMIRDDGAVKVLDFGIARRRVARPEGEAAPIDEAETLTGEGVLLGSPLYMSPEQIRGATLDARTDQFSWAVTAYEVLAGRHPWRKSEALQSVAEILVAEPAPLASVARGTPSHVVAVIERALAKDPAQRFPTMHALVEALAPDAPSLAPSRMPAPALASELATTGAATVESGEGVAPPPAPSRSAAARAWIAFGAIAAASLGVAAFVARAPRPPAPGSDARGVEPPSFDAPAAPSPPPPRPSCARSPRRVARRRRCRRRRRASIPSAIKSEAARCPRLPQSLRPPAPSRAACSAPAATSCATSAIPSPTRRASSPATATSRASCARPSRWRTPAPAGRRALSARRAARGSSS